MGFIEQLRSFFAGEETRSNEELTEVEITSEGQLMTALMPETIITKKRAMEIPTIAATLNLIKGTVRNIPLKLYEKDENGQVHEVANDERVFMLNFESGDTLNASQIRDAIIEDYYLNGGGYIYINREGNKIKSLHYVENENVSTQHNQHPIFKDYNILVYNKTYHPCDFVKILRDTKDGAEGTGIIEQNPLILKVAYNTLKFENNLVATGGNKKGFITSVRKLGDEAIRRVKEAWKKLYSSNDENVVILNEGLSFKESSNTSVEMQLNESKQTNLQQMTQLFNVPSGMLTGCDTKKASEDDKEKFRDFCIIPLLKVIVTALNRDLLLESEKKTKFFDFDTNDIKKGSLLERMNAYKVALDENIMLLDEVRKIENLSPLGFNFLNLNLGGVLYNADTGKGFVPNTGETFDMTEFMEKGGGVNGKDEG